MLGLFSKRDLAHGELLAAIPHRNRSVQATPMGTGKFHLAGPVRESRFRKFFGTQALQKKFELDELGLEVWNACDGRVTVEAIIRRFAQGHQVNVREAEIAVSTFLKSLTRRNLVALAVTPQAPASGRVARRQKERNHDHRR